MPWQISRRVIRRIKRCPGSHRLEDREVIGRLLVRLHRVRDWTVGSLVKVKGEMGIMMKAVYSLWGHTSSVTAPINVVVIPKGRLEDLWIRTNRPVETVWRCLKGRERYRTKVDKTDLQPSARLLPSLRTFRLRQQLYHPDSPSLNSYHRALSDSQSVLLGHSDGHLVNLFSYLYRNYPKYRVTLSQ